MPHLPLVLASQSPRRRRLLEEAGLSPRAARAADPREVAAVLGVDAVVSGDVVAEQLMRTGGAVVLQVLAGAGGGTAHTPTEDITVDLRIHAGEDGTLLWRCEGGDMGEFEQPQRVAKAAVNDCAGHFPYTEEPLGEQAPRPRTETPPLTRAGGGVRIRAPDPTGCTSCTGG